MFERKGALAFFCSNNQNNQLEGQLRNSIYNQFICHNGGQLNSSCNKFTINLFDVQQTY